MAARAGMSELIAKLRGFTAAGTADYTVGTVPYWTDDQLQAVLDRHRVDFRRESLMVEPTYDGNSVRYYDFYFSKHEFVEGTASGSAAWRIENGAGTVIAAGTANYSVNMDARLISFAADTAGTPFYLTGREYDLYRAAVEIWEQKAADVWDAFDLKTDNHDMTRSQKNKHALIMAAQYRKRAKPMLYQRRRVDVN